MAEERLLDDDKDKKYRFRINADGEEELIVGEGEDIRPVVEEAELSFDEAEDYEDYAYDGEDDERYTTHEDEKAVAALLERAREDVEQGNFSTALEYVDQASDILPDDGEVAAMELTVYTKNLTDFSQNVMPQALTAAKKVSQFTSAESKKRLAETGADRLNSMICALQSQADELSERNEQGKAERAVRFDADNKKAMTRFFVSLAPLALFVALAVYFSTIMFADDSGVFIVLTIVFAVLSLICFAVCVFTARAFNITARRVRMNRDNSRTQVGRDYEACMTRLSALRTIYDAVTK